MIVVAKPRCENCDRESYGLKEAADGRRICPACVKKFAAAAAEAAMEPTPPTDIQEPIQEEPEVQSDILQEEAPVVEETIEPDTPPIFDKEVTGKVKPSQLNVRAKPAADGIVVDILRKDYVFPITDEKEAKDGTVWVQIGGEDKWVNKTFVEVM